MTTPRDLLIIAMDVKAERSVEHGDLSLALAGAEVIDLLGLQAVALDDDRVVPGDPSGVHDRLLGEAVSSLAGQEPGGSVEDWLWNRGRGLSSAYLSAFEAEGQLARQRRGWTLFGAGRTVRADSPARRRAAERWTSHEPVLTALAGTVGIPVKQIADVPGIADDKVALVLAAVSGAVVELEAARQRRAIEQAAFDNIWRGQ